MLAHSSKVKDSNINLVSLRCLFDSDFTFLICMKCICTYLCCFVFLPKIIYSFI